MAYNNSSLAGSALIWSLASLGNSGSGGSGGADGKPGSQWYFLPGPIAEDEPAQSYMNVGDVVLDQTDTEIFKVVLKDGKPVLESTGVTLRPESEQQKSLYQLYLDLEPKKKLTEAQFHDAFLEALENEDFNLYEFYKASGGLKYTTEKEFVDQFIKVMDLDLDALDIETDRIVSKDGTVSVIAGNDGVEVDTKDMNINASATISIEAVNVMLEAGEVFIGSTKDIVDGSTKITGVIDPVNDLDAVNKRTLDKAVGEIKDSLDTLDGKIDDLEAKHDKDVQDLLDLNTSLNQKVVELEKKHDEDMANLQNQILTFLNGYLKDELPKMVEEEVKKYLEANPPSGDGCNCENWPPDVIDGNVWPEVVKDTILIWDNGKATSTDFDYIMADLWDAAITEDDDRLANGGTSNPDNEPKDVLTFEEWLERLDKTNIYEGGNSSEKDLLESQYFLYLGGSASSEW